MSTKDETKVPTSCNESSSHCKVISQKNDEDSSSSVTKVPKQSLNNNLTDSVVVSHQENNSSDNISERKARSNVNDPPAVRYSKEDQDGAVEKFDGKIVYNPDGSAYIIDNAGEEVSEDETLLPKQEGSIIERPGEPTPESGLPTYPQIANAIYITRSAAYYNALYGRAYAKILRDKLISPQAPVVHTYKVFSMRSQPKETISTACVMPELPTAVPVKPILMCFICKLSFGYAKSFESHCTSEHDLDLTEEEKKVLDSKNCSAIIQLVGQEKKPIVSFLEPVVKNQSGPHVDNEQQSSATPISVANKQKEPSTPSESPRPQALSPNAIKGLLSAALTQNLAAAASANNNNNSNDVLINEGMSTRSSPPFPFPLPPDFSLPHPGFLDNFPLPLPLRNQSLSDCSGPMSGGIPSNANMLQGNTIGACPEHVNGRQSGVDCTKCDLILNRIPGGLALNTARNSCKTLKCPKCNWHYKYQETLEIHMKEKHPENEASCIYCITGQQHPRLARGETYTCGYKPYRCEVCNYSTTTKGNLSIHMQSDKHLNNMQELQNGNNLVNTSDRLSHSPVGRGMPPSALVNMVSKQKPNWRCDICNYETNVARNLRIHMTSEKHTHNIMVLQQNVKHLQQLSQGSNSNGNSPMGLPFPLLPGMEPQHILQQMPMSNLNMQEKQQPQQPEAAMADLAYLQAVMMQMMTGGQLPGPMPPNFNIPDMPGSPIETGSPDLVEPPPEAPDPNPQYLFNCCVCKDFGSDSMEILAQHLTQDRTKFREHEISIVIAGNFICKLCSYKTNLKANFQLHCKTDKHLQRLNHVNHIKEGGTNNEWKLKFLNVMNPVQLRCNACDYYTNSLHKLQLHVANQRHEISTILFSHLKKCEMSIGEHKERFYQCSLCKFRSEGKLLLMAHVRSMKHLQMEQIHQLQKRSEGNIGQTEIGDIFQVVEGNSADNNENDSGKLFQFKTVAFISIVLYSFYAWQF
jgi:AT-binding transcription factor 1